MDFLDGLRGQTVTIEPFTGQDMNGDRTYGPAVTYSCREEAVVRLIKNQQGEDVVNTSRVFLAPNVVVGYYDRITLGNGTQPIILKINANPDVFGTNAYVEVDT